MGGGGSYFSPRPESGGRDRAGRPLAALPTCPLHVGTRLRALSRRYIGSLEGPRESRRTGGARTSRRCRGRRAGESSLRTPAITGGDKTLAFHDSHSADALWEHVPTRPSHESGLPRRAVPLPGRYSEGADPRRRRGGRSTADVRGSESRLVPGRRDGAFVQPANRLRTSRSAFTARR